jgi:D-alanyl-D-alanine carboxypeptidase (penicillin-binding protein 5/6)
MSRELITKYPQITNYSTIWMENITHVTARGTSEFGLANTNKLLKQYEWTTGLKTGSTSKAKYCLSATADKDGIELIAVIMAAPDYKLRFSEAKTLLEYGYAHCSLYRDTDRESLGTVAVEQGVYDEVPAAYKEEFTYLSTTGENLSEIQKNIEFSETVKAPVKKGDVLGQVVYYLGEKKLGSVDIIAAEGVRKSSYGDCLKKLLWKLWL